MLKIIISIVSLTIISSTFYGLWVFPQHNVHIFVCSVGQGDSILIQRAFFQVVIDSGPSTGLLECLGKHKPFWDKKIEMIVLTHPQVDHYGGFVELLKRYEVGAFVANGYPSESTNFGNLVNELQKQKPLLIQPHSGSSLSLPGGMNLSFVWPEEKVGDLNTLIKNRERSQASMLVDDPNQISLVFNFRFSQFDMLFTGDIGIYEELALNSKGLLKEVEILKVPHHGSKYSSSEGFLRVVSPEVSVISSGENNRFGHPHPEVILRLKAINSKIYRTDLNNDIEIITDGRSYQIRP